MKMNADIRLLLATLIAFGLVAGGCRKAFLAQKPSSNLLIPNSLMVFQELLDNTQVMNASPALGEVSADNYYLFDNTWASLDTRQHNAYIWAKDLYGGQGQVTDWDIPYQQVFYANTVLQGLAGLQPDSTDAAAWNLIKGWALFSRANAFFNITQLFAEPYDPAKLADPGIPIRLTPDINEKTTRATMQDSYNQILGDLHEAERLLPAAIPVKNLNRPSQPAVRALLSRIYLSMRDYADAEKCADSVLQAHSFLLPYDTTLAKSVLPFSNNMPEVIYQSNFPSTGNVLEGIVCGGCIVDTNFLASYAPNDLRVSVYYRQEGTASSDTFTLKGSYSGTVFPFSGLATDELYLIRAECAARADDVTDALTDLDALLSHRWIPGTFIPFPDSLTAEQTLDTVLVERRKELAFRGIRWSDLRRLNQEGRGAILYRKINGQSDSILPSSNRYTLPIPPDVIRFSGIAQNPR